MFNPSNANKIKYFEFDHDVPINKHAENSCCESNFHGEHSQWENCQLGHLGWYTVYMMAFHTEDILKADLVTSYGLLIKKQ